LLSERFPASGQANFGAEGFQRLAGGFVKAYAVF
jgi:hypothetical protein